MLLSSLCDPDWFVDVVDVYPVNRAHTATDPDNQDEYLKYEAAKTTDKYAGRQTNIFLVRSTQRIHFSQSRDERTLSVLQLVGQSTRYQFYIVQHASGCRSILVFRQPTCRRHLLLQPRLSDRARKGIWQGVEVHLKINTYLRNSNGLTKRKLDRRIYGQPGTSRSECTLLHPRNSPVLAVCLGYL